MSANEAVAPLPEEQADRPYTAVVTGSDSGIGRAIAAALAGGGVDVGITYHQDAEGAKRTAEEVRQQGVRAAVNSVAPGEISTPMSGQEDVDPRQQRRPGVPLGRTGHAREVAAFLATPAAGYVTGASYVVDGGMLLMGPQGSSLLGDDAWRHP